MKPVSARRHFPRNLILIAMPRSGKSTVGVLLAKRLAWRFADTDVVMQARIGAPLRVIQERLGRAGFRRLEEQCLQSLKGTRQVIATGGSAVYYPRAMAHLQSLGALVFLDVPLAELKKRLTDFEVRGVVRAPGQTVESLWRERRPLYRRYAQVTVPWRREPHEPMVERILNLFQGAKPPLD